MKYSEILHILTAILILTIVSGFSLAFKSDWQGLLLAFIFSFIIIFISILAKKISAHLLDSDIEHEIWQMKHFGFSSKSQFKKPIIVGIIFPLITTILSLGTLKFSALLTYETRALKHRAAKRFGYYSFTEMTDWHNALIGTAGILALLILTLITYLLPYNLVYLSKLSLYYAFWNLLPISKLDGTQILFGSRTLWSILALITATATILALITV